MPNAIGTNAIGPSFGAELAAAGLFGLPFSWGADGAFQWSLSITDAQKAAVQAVFSAHNPSTAYTPVPASISRRQFFQQLAIQTIITDAEALTAMAGTIPSELATLINGLPAGQQFAAKMLISGATQFDRANSFTTALGAAYSLTSAQIDAIWIAAGAL